MPTGYNIDAETRRLIHNYNNKVYRQRKKGETVDYLRLSEFAGFTETRQAQTLKYAEAYRRRGSERMTEYGVKQYELDYANMLLSEVNAARRERLEKMGASPYKGNMGIVARANLQPRQMNFITPADFAKMLKSLEKEATPDFWKATDEAYKENYFAAARENLGKTAERRLRRLLKDVDAADIYLLGVDNPELFIDHVYLTAESDAKERTDFIVSRWNSVLKARK